MFSHVATVGQIHREFFAIAEQPRQYCASLLRRLEKNGFLQKRSLPARGRGRPLVAYQISAQGARAVGKEASLRQLRNMKPWQLTSRLQLTEMIQARADEGWQPVHGDNAFLYLKRWAIKVNAGRFVDSTKSFLLGNTKDDTPMRHHVLIRPGKNGVPVEARIILIVHERTRLRSYLKRLPDFYGFPTVVFEVVTASASELKSAEKELDRLAKKRKFRFTIEWVAAFHTRPLVDRLSRAARKALARKPMGWEPWLRVKAAQKPEAL